MTSSDAKSDYGSDIDANLSDYGSEFDPEEDILIGDLLQRIAASAPRAKSLVYTQVAGEHVPEPTVLVHSSPPSAVVRLREGAVVQQELAPPTVATEAEGDKSPSHLYRRASEGPSIVQNGTQIPKPRAPSVPAEPSVTNDQRSPLERFRTKPKKPLSVTDLVSPAWCELQYWYVLTKFGRKPQTQAMKQGSRVHKVLEEQVHAIVPIQTQSREDRFGLKLWNTVQGLRTLRATGLTRELEVWGTVDGQLVNGIIDEVSFARPDVEFQKGLAKGKPAESTEKLPDGQKVLEDYDTNSLPGTDGMGRVVYIADVKTRGVKSVPLGASLRPTWMQLMLYRKLLEALAQNTVDSDTIFARYDLRPLEPFTDTFLNDMADLAGGVDVDEAMSDSDCQPTVASLPRSEIGSYSNLSALWSLMIAEFRQTIGSVSDVLRAEFRYSSTGELIGSELFIYDTKAVEEYLSKEMEWWKGEREAVGVEVEEAFKCRVCDFAEQCSWRKNKVEEAMEKHRLRAAERAKSVV